MGGSIRLNYLGRVLDDFTDETTGGLPNKLIRVTTVFQD
jgi:hypothetical protein